MGVPLTGDHTQLPREGALCSAACQKGNTGCNPSAANSGGLLKPRGHWNRSWVAEGFKELGRDLCATHMKMCWYRNIHTVMCRVQTSPAHNLSRTGASQPQPRGPGLSVTSSLTSCQPSVSRTLCLEGSNIYHPLSPRMVGRTHEVRLLGYTGLKLTVGPSA